MTTPFITVGRYEYAQTDTAVLYRPNRQSARWAAYFHAGCLTLLMVFFGVPSILIAVVFGVIHLHDVLHADLVTGIAFGVSGVALVGLLFALYKFARFIFRKSLRDNWQTMRVARDGTIVLGDQELVAAGQARRVVVNSQTLSDGEGGYTDVHSVEIELALTSSAPIVIPVPFYGAWHKQDHNKHEAQKFAITLASALGIAGPTLSETPPEEK